MLKFAKLSVKERTPYFNEVANRRGLRQLIVEKDFWVCFILDCLFNVPKLKENLVFKGGTSLSKVFGIIKRFSEDIDLTIDPSWCGFNDENLPEKAASRTKQRGCCDKLRVECGKKVQNEIQSILEEKIKEKLGPPDSYSSYLSYNYDEESKSPILIFRYPTEEVDSGGYNRPLVKLEFGSHTGTKPNGIYTIISWVAEEFPDIFESPKFNIVSLNAERTFWEKATILHAEYHRDKASPMRMRLSRDLYDLYCMAKFESGQKALSNVDLLKTVVEHKQLYFPSARAKYEDAKPGTLCLSPPDHRLSELKSDYKEMEDMFTEDPPIFTKLISKIKEIENHINKR